MRPDSHRPSRLRLCTLALLIGGFFVSAAGGTPRHPGKRSPADGYPGIFADLGSDVPANIPDRALLQAADLHGAATTAVEDEDWARLRPPQPCAGDAFPSTVLRRGERAVSAIVEVDGKPTRILEYLAVYRSNGPHRYLRDLRRALEACHGVDDRGGRWKIVATRGAGPDSVLLRVRDDVQDGGNAVTRDTYVAVARVGRLLVVVADVGGETAAGHRGLVEELITPAVRRASILL
jgi:hypothetical protein